MPSPHLALSIRQPWAWLIVHGHKDVENRNWSTIFRGPVWVHASKGMTKWEYEVCAAMAHRIRPSIIFPKFNDLPRGGIVGKVSIIECTMHHPSTWFVGDYGFTLSDPVVTDFRPCKGMLGFFTPTFNEVLA
jgi:hypothetical protein